MGTYLIRDLRDVETGLLHFLLREGRMSCAICDGNFALRYVKHVLFPVLLLLENLRLADSQERR